MPNCDFYALKDDMVSVVDFVTAECGCSLFELSSELGQEVREFRASSEVLSAFDIGSRHQNFQLYAPSMKGKVRFERIDFSRVEGDRPPFRYDTEGWGLIQLYFGALRDGHLGSSHTNHNSEKRASAWEPTYIDKLGAVSDWDWREITRISSKLNRWIRKVAPQKIGPRPILPTASRALADGALQLDR